MRIVAGKFRGKQLLSPTDDSIRPTSDRARESMFNILASRLGPAQPRGVGWKGAGGWLIFSQSRQVNFSRMVWITFHCRGMTSSVSVMSSPIFTMRVDPQQVQEAGASTTTRSRGK